MRYVRQLATASHQRLSGGKFDGAWLGENSTRTRKHAWAKQDNLYSKIDAEVLRDLGFERYWGGHVNLNAEERQFIVDELFIGNKLAAGKIIASDGIGVDLRNIRFPSWCSVEGRRTSSRDSRRWMDPRPR